VYAWPSFELAATLPGGTERAYSAACFDSAGQLLAAVGSAPDYMLTLWSWRSGQVVLRSKAFSQEVYTVRFSPYFAGRLITSGTGHIQFWRMTSTFTGLKLQVRACALVGGAGARRGCTSLQPLCQATHHTQPSPNQPPNSITKPNQTNQPKQIE